MPLDDAADRLLDVMAERHDETQYSRGLLDARREWSATRVVVRQAALRRIAQSPRLRSRTMTPQVASAMAVMILHNMKTMAILVGFRTTRASRGAITELLQMNRLYITSRFS